MLEKICSIEGLGTELMYLRGKMLRPEKQKVKNGQDMYYTFILKVLRNPDADEYDQQYSLYKCVMPVLISKTFTDSDILTLKGNEVSVLCTPRGSSRRSVNKTTGQEFVNFDIDLSVMEVELFRELPKAVNTLEVVGDSTPGKLPPEKIAL